MTLWRLDELARADTEAILLRSPQGIHGAMETSMARRINGIAEKLLQTHAEVLKPELAILGSGSINAFAFFNGNQPTIAISQGMVRLLADDDDAWAALIGHELAHLRLEHLKKQIDRRQRTDVASSVAGVVLSAFGLPFASIATDATAVLATRAYSRDDEREADRVGLEYMRNAGFAADGAIRLQRQLLAAGGNSGMPFLSTHPGGEERIENLRQLMHSDK
jgi:predicted Zn-dependent protease